MCSFVVMVECQTPEIYLPHNVQVESKIKCFREKNIRSFSDTVQVGKSYKHPKHAPSACSNSKNCLRFMRYYLEYTLLLLI